MTTTGARFLGALVGAEAPSRGRMTGSVSSKRPGFGYYGPLDGWSQGLRGRAAVVIEKTSGPRRETSGFWPSAETFWGNRASEWSGIVDQPDR